MFNDNLEDFLVEKLVNTNEEEDYENFFLQPATSPYNMADKIAEANMLLLNESFEEEREVRVKFREVIADFEPELTDDDVQSIESYNEVDYSIIEDPIEVLKYQKDSFHDTIYETEEEDEIEEEILEDVIKFDEIEEEIEEDVIKFEEEIVEEEDVTYVEDKSISCEVDESYKNEDSCDEEEELKRKIKRKSRRNVDINCKNHCIESFLVSDSSKKAIEKPQCPPLKLHQRNCCDSKSEPKLPIYEGLRSEYGLSSAQLEKRERRRALIRAKQEKRQELQEEYRKRRIQQNELIFCQWLREISERDRVPLKQRPKTAEATSAKKERHKRPHSTNCVYIKIPQDLLKKGLKIGEVIITKNNIINDTLNILRIS